MKLNQVINFIRLQLFSFFRKVLESGWDRGVEMQKGWTEKSNLSVYLCV
ncbi:hypothetical protein [Bacteroides oleiciplenus]|uniref:Uncharacterized protein n=1 Tax=Bacteroides oleiciplenus YIT 12058 TaxID=742727 RepID=K9EI65_9BACE|nr:hypothetical protein [Bacteroides oleiciplenus]EKU90677.1 hypothetical protein HMPREF9447_02095 [Bacteroides oleiciplenus YIT 12058]